MAAFLVLQAARFGDLVQTKRLIRSLERRGEVHLAVDESLVPLATLLYPQAQVYGLPLYAAGPQDALSRCRAVLSSWADCRFDAVYNCNYSSFTAALCRSFAPESICGYRPAPGGILRSPWARLTFRLSETRSATTLNLVDFWAYFSADAAASYAPISPSAVNPAAAPGGRGLGVVLAGRESRRSLPVPLLAEMVQTAFKALDGPCIYFLGSKAEQPAGRKLMRLLPAKVQEKTVDLSGKTDWTGLSEAVRGLDALLSPDTGIMHLAAHWGVPVLGFFLSSAWCRETGPYGQGHHIWQAVRACAPCLESAPCPDRIACGVPFHAPEMLRSLACVLRGQGAAGERLVEDRLPRGVQLLRSGLDDFGVIYERIAGEDDGRDARRCAARALLREFLLLPAAVNAGSAEVVPAGDSMTDAAADVAVEVRSRLFRDEDWMLPPGRYC